MQGSAAALLLLLPWTLLLHAAAAGNGSCARSCGGLTVQYPFGFSPGCEIQLGCDDRANGTAWLGGARELGLLVHNVTARAVVLALPQDCSRRLDASVHALFSESYAPVSQNALVLSACSPTSPSLTSNCSDSDRYINRSSSRCNTTDEPIRCVLPPAVAPPPSISSASSVNRFFNRTEMQMIAAECTGLVSAASYWDTPAPGLMELEWWVVGGTCRCSRHATCTPVTTLTAGQRAFRCECPEGFHGDGFADGAGCWKAGPSQRGVQGVRRPGAHGVGGP